MRVYNKVQVNFGDLILKHLYLGFTSLSKSKGIELFIGSSCFLAYLKDRRKGFRGLQVIPKNPLDSGALGTQSRNHAPQGLNLATQSRNHAPQGLNLAKGRLNKELFLQWLKDNALFEMETPFLVLEYKEFEVVKGADAPKALKSLKGLSGVYAWYCVITGKIYVGGAENLFLRGFKAHYLNRSSNKHLQADIRLHGLTNFLFIILKVSGKVGEIVDIDLTNDEQFFLNAFPKAVKFNIAPIARSNRGVIYSDETKKRISDAMIGKNVGKSHPHSPEWRQAVSSAMTGLVRSNETKAKISASKKGVPLSEAHKAALKAAWVRRLRGTT
jgi:group I intron endonuclease